MCWLRTGPVMIVFPGMCDVLWFHLKSLTDGRKGRGEEG